MLKLLFALCMLIAWILLPYYSKGQHTIFDTSYNKLTHKNKKKQFYTASGKLLVSEISVFAYDRFSDKDYSKISFQTAGHNLNPANWKWDSDIFMTNQVGHPYHGSFYFSSFRKSGYNFWQSVQGAFAGSYLWETFGENEAPSPNDFINTGFGGSILGEVTYRLSNKIVNNRSIGFKRQLNEVAAFLLNPMNGLSRITFRKWGKPNYHTNDYDTTKITTEFNGGIRWVNPKGADPFDGRLGWCGRVKLQYGKPTENVGKPFSNFYVLVEFGQDSASGINIINVYGSLLGWRIPADHASHLLVLSANYDYIHNAAFVYGAQSVKLNLLSEFSFNNKVKLNTSFGAGAIVLAAIPDEYKYLTREYDYGPGFSFHGLGIVKISDRVTYSANYRGALVKTVNGNRSDYFVHLLTSEISVRLVDKISLTAESAYYGLHGNYSNFLDVNKSYSYFRLSLNYNSVL